MRGSAASSPRFCTSPLFFSFFAASFASARVFTRFIEIGRVVLVNDGKFKNKLAVIVDVIDMARVRWPWGRMLSAAVVQRAVMQRAHAVSVCAFLCAFSVVERRGGGRERKEREKREKRERGPLRQHVASRLQRAQACACVCGRRRVRRRVVTRGGGAGHGGLAVWTMCACHGRWIRRLESWPPFFFRAPWTVPPFLASLALHHATSIPASHVPLPPLLPVPVPGARGLPVHRRPSHGSELQEPCPHRL